MNDQVAADAARLALLERLLQASEDAARVVDIAQSSNSPADFVDRAASAFGFDERQARAVLDMQVRRFLGQSRAQLKDDIAAVRTRLDLSSP